MRARETGLATVEFAIIGTLFFIVLFAVIEFGRLLFVWNGLTEAARRGARVAAVCPVNDSAIKNIAIFNAPAGGGSSPIIAGLTTANVAVEYLNDAGAVIADPAANFGAIQYTRVRITGFTFTMLIPTFNLALAAPEFATTLPRESLGVSPEGVSCF